MNKFDFYNDLNFKEEDKKNQINNSLSLPIGIITGLVAGLFYLLTAFDFKLSFWDSIVFSVISLTSIFFLGISIFHLIKSYSNFHKGYDYAYLADTIDLDKYYKELKKYYNTNPILTDTSDTEFELYIFDELVKNTDINQKNNKKKNKHRFNCEKHLITAFLFLCLNLFPFGYNYALKKDMNKSILLELNFKENHNFKDRLIFNHQTMADKKIPPAPKPTPPPSQLIKEGQEPRTKPQTTTPFPQTNTTKK
jgi:predicted membrane channel-forming protein YqfA (hemolysin III family)